MPRIVSKDLDICACARVCVCVCVCVSHRASKKRFDAEEDFKTRAREMVTRLQSGEPEVGVHTHTHTHRVLTYAVCECDRGRHLPLCTHTRTHAQAQHTHRDGHGRLFRFFYQRLRELHTQVLQAWAVSRCPHMCVCVYHRF